MPGFRMVYLCLSKPDLVVAVAPNSKVNDGDDHIGTLAGAILQAATARP